MYCCRFTLASIALSGKITLRSIQAGGIVDALIGCFPVVGILSSVLLASLRAGTALILVGSTLTSAGTALVALTALAILTTLSLTILSALPLTTLSQTGVGSGCAQGRKGTGRTAKLRSSAGLHHGLKLRKRTYRSFRIIGRQRLCGCIH